MKLIVPYIGQLRLVDERLLRLGEFLGISCDPLALAKVSEYGAFLEKAVPDRCSCFVVNPQVMKEWVGMNTIPTELVVFLLSHFTHLLVHGLRVDAFDTAIVVALSGGKLQSVDTACGECPVYVIASDSKDVCEAFSGLSFGPANPGNDHVLRTNGSDPAVRSLISICGRPFMAAVKLDRAEVLFVASEDVADLNAEVGDAPLATYFSRFVPHAMALRYVAADECWRPREAHAAIIIDDPLLRKSYGYLNFASLLRLADDHDFHTAIAFIPHNFRRNSSRITRMFQENTGRLSICFHGNDHTESEFASTDPALLNTLLQMADGRMTLHNHTTGLPCDRVMVFPQGNFSIEAMKVLKCHNFYAAVNTVPHPSEQPIQLTIGELAQPAVLRYGGFALFIRRSIRETQSHNIAFNLFFGRPVLIVEHHDVFQHPEALGQIAAKINSVAPEIHWSNLATVVSNSLLIRGASDGTHHVRAYSSKVQISNTSTSLKRYRIEWGASCDCGSTHQVLVDGTRSPDVEIHDSRSSLSVNVAPGSSRTVSLVHLNVPTTVRSLGVRWYAQAFLRRRLSEVRDNYLSKNRHLLAVAKAFQRQFLQ